MYHQHASQSDSVAPDENIFNYGLSLVFFQTVEIHIILDRKEAILQPLH